MAKNRTRQAGTKTDNAAGRFVVDYVSGERVRAPPEEVQAVQVFARRLVDDYGYRKDQVQTHPQHRVRARPSDQARSDGVRSSNP